MSARTLFFSFLIAGVLAAPLISAQDKKDAAKPNNARFGNPTDIGRKVQGDLYGVIKSVKEGEIVLDKTKFGVDQDIRLEPKTKYIRDGKSSTFDQLKVGDPVYVNLKTDKKTGVMTAKRVTSGVIAAP
jgi:hypothetical protein